MAPDDRKGLGGLPAWLLPALPDRLKAEPARTIGFSGRQSQRVRERRKPTPTGCMAKVREFLKAQPRNCETPLAAIVKATGHTSAEIGSSLSKLMQQGCVKAEKHGRANLYSWDEAGRESRPYRLNK